MEQDETRAALRALNVAPWTIEAILAANPELTAGRVREQYANALARVSSRLVLAMQISPAAQDRPALAADHPGSEPACAVLSGAGADRMLSGSRFP